MNFSSHTFDFNGDAGEILSLFQDEPGLFFLDSSQMNDQTGRYSFLGFDPFDVFESRGDVRALERLRQKYAPFIEKESLAFPFVSGIVGFLAYDYGLLLENISSRAQADILVPDCFFGFYDRVIMFDHHEKKIHVFSSGQPEKGEKARRRAEKRLVPVVEKLRAYLGSSQNKPEIPSDALSAEAGADISLDPFECNFSRGEYLRAVKKALDYISAGDIYQVNLSQRFALDLVGREIHPINIYKRLRWISPSPFGAYLKGKDFTLLSHSPERFLLKQGSLCRTRPMKGTRPRGINPAKDKEFANELMASAKDKAELLMIVDLERNDLGRVCDYGSVRVKEMRALESYQTVFQTTSTIEGRVREGQDSFDVLKACFPGGSITGCPKIRSMEIIDELEPTRRSFYTGALGYINFSGDMDFSILIRTLLACRDKIYFQVGGGIVADSVPEEEYQETMVKAKGLFACLQDVIGSRPISGVVE